MNNLYKMYTSLLAEELTSNIFSVSYNGKGFACILVIQDYGCSLYLSTLGDRSKTIAIDIPASFEAPASLDQEAYYLLARYLGFKGTTGNKFYPSKFFEEFDSHISPFLNRQATIKEKSRAVGQTVNIAEDDKIYFCGWRKNGDTGHVSSKNYAKTRKLVGEKIANDLLRLNISSRWTNIEGDENLSSLNEYLNMLN